MPESDHLARLADMCWSVLCRITVKVKGCMRSKSERRVDVGDTNLQDIEMAVV